MKNKYIFCKTSKNWKDEFVLGMKNYDKLGLENLV